MKFARGFTLLETAAVLAIGSLLFGVLAPAVKMSRSHARGVDSAANLMFIGQGSAMYAQDNGGRLFTYTWAGPTPGQGSVFFLMPDGKTRSASSDQEAASWQNTEILMRRTGRLEGSDRIANFSGRLPHRRNSHLPLMDYLNVPFPSTLFADPADANLAIWQANPTDVTLASNIPYAPGSDYGGTMINRAGQMSASVSVGRSDRAISGRSRRGVPTVSTAPPCCPSRTRPT